MIKHQHSELNTMELRCIIRVQKGKFKIKYVVHRGKRAKMDTCVNMGTPPKVTTGDA